MRTASFPVSLVVTYQIDNYPIPDYVQDEDVYDYVSGKMAEIIHEDVEYILEDQEPIECVELFDDDGNKIMEFRP